MEEQKSGFSKRKLRIFAGLFLALLVICTLAGNTLRSMSLPKVYTQPASKGSVAHEYEGSATVQPGQTLDIANPAGWKVKKVLVKQGDKVSAGQKLIEYDDSEWKLQLDDMQTNLKKQQLSMDQLQANYIAAVTEGSESALAEAKIAIESAKLDIASQKQHILSLQKSMTEGQSVSAPFTGVVIQVNASAGTAPGLGPELVLANSAKGNEIRLQVPGDVAGLLEIGEVLDQITLSDKSNRQLSGTIVSIDDGESGGEGIMPANAGDDSNNTSSLPSSVTISLKDDNLKGGDRVEVKIAKTSEEQTVTVPNEAVHHDERGAFVFTLEGREGPLGNAYYAVETPVKIADSNAYVTSIAEGLFEQQEVIVNSTGFLLDGTRVRR
ncbi:efflux RND transporter periplasmic adaptor subunit [Paenibacillus glycanilyticus]|uniref:efflux RND transporter periplasmic adaptor subunit n=1 Tax=Paenibacillus glycanilyticus TaxID=126569 RepID=UPI0020412421|nr:efflux RND transporter periplasmic adaptor subunit [Paenibacillus glycanilyticus]MCM3628320.1 efflux RND transporter periplasmic adaptor subunit [Paenibacillus glycanilyticus]